MIRKRWAFVSDQNVVEIIFLDFSCQIDANLNLVFDVLLFNCMQKGVEPFGGAEITDDPCEVDL